MRTSYCCNAETYFVTYSEDHILNGHVVGDKVEICSNCGEEVK